MKNVMNKNLGEDLNYEQDVNYKMEGDLLNFENEKEKLLMQVQDYEGKSRIIGADTLVLSKQL
jgi:hypothetical protein